MEIKRVVQYVSYTIGMITLLTLVGVVPIQVVLLTICAGINLLYIEWK